MFRPWWYKTYLKHRSDVSTKERDSCFENMENMDGLIEVLLYHQRKSICYAVSGTWQTLSKLSTWTDCGDKWEADISVKEFVLCLFSRFRAAVHVIKWCNSSWLDLQDQFLEGFAVGPKENKQAGNAVPWMLFCLVL